MRIKLRRQGPVALVLMLSAVLASRVTGQEAGDGRPVGSVAPLEAEVDQFMAINDKINELLAKHQRMLAQAAKVRNLDKDLYLKFDPDHRIFLVYSSAPPPTHAVTPAVAPVGSATPVPAGPAPVGSK